MVSGETCSIDQPTVFVIDDDEAFRVMMGRLLRSTGLPSRMYPAADEFLNTCEPDPRGCLLLDVRLPRMSGRQLQKELTSRRIELPVIFISGHGDIEMAVNCMKAGAVDFIEKPFREQLLVESIRRAFQQDAEQRADAARRRALGRQLADLTPREEEVLGFVLRGTPSKQIAAELGISTKAVEAHRSHLLRKLAAGSSIELVRKVLTA